jgi:HPt (histidine-containing phosphotransfer) domain-containing protein
MEGYPGKPVRPRELSGAIAGLGPAHPAPGAGARGGVRAPSAAAHRAEVVDRAQALDRVGGDRDLLRELTDLFLEECPKLLAGLRAALAQGQPAQVRLLAHNLKGAIDNFAAQEAVDAAARLEALGRAGDLTCADKAWSALEAEIDRLKPALAALARDLEGRE